MSDSEKQLYEISEMIKKGTAASKVTVRTFLGWFGVQRRGGVIVQQIREALEKHGLQTIPDFDQTYIDGEIAIVQATGTTPVDPTYRIGRLEAANKKPIYVAPDAKIDEAVTLMLAKDFSQLPVMTSEREVKGVISWKSIGSRLSLNQKCDTVKSCMDAAEIVPSDMPLFDAIERIASKEYILVRDETKVITGIVTASDLSTQFRQLAEPFMLLGEIENYVRRMLQGRFTREELEKVKDPTDTTRNVDSVSDLTFGEYLRLLEDPQHWTKLNLKIDRAIFISQLDKVREIRNGVMHFDPDGPEQGEVDTLRQFAAFMQGLASINAI